MDYYGYTIILNCNKIKTSMIITKHICYMSNCHCEKLKHAISIDSQLLSTKVCCFVKSVFRECVDYAKAKNKSKNKQNIKFHVHSNCTNSTKQQRESLLRNTLIKFVKI